MNELLPQPFVDSVEGYVQLNMLAEASTECLRMVQSQPLSTDLLVYCAGTVSLGTNEQIQELLSVLDKFLVNHADDYQVREVRAVLLGLLKRYPESLAEFAKVPEDKKRHDARWVWFKTLINAGAEHQIWSWIQNVWPTYSHQVRQADFSTYLKFLWDVSAQQVQYGFYEEAAYGYRFLLANDPGAIDLYLQYGKLLIRLNKLDKAWEIFQQGLNLSQKQIDGQNCYPGAIGYFAHERDHTWHDLNVEVRRLAA